ncbi:MAG: DUF1572 family protein [Anaerolineae bacterium]|nr:DUF1572 family protein [Phycisphaerae bacterium]
MIERAIRQLTDAELHQRPAPSFNSIAVIMQHMAGNLISRWTDFLTTDGEKPDRNREGEFDDVKRSRDQLMQHWERGFRVLFDSLESLRPDDLSKTVYIRAEAHSVPQAIVRAMDHVAYHTGQILFIARLVHSGEWNYVTMKPERDR